MLVSLLLLLDRVKWVACCKNVPRRQRQCVEEEEKERKKILEMWSEFVWDDDVPIGEKEGENNREEDLFFTKSVFASSKKCKWEEDLFLFVVLIASHDTSVSFAGFNCATRKEERKKERKRERERERTKWCAVLCCAVLLLSFHQHQPSSSKWKVEEEKTARNNLLGNRNTKKTQQIARLV